MRGGGATDTRSRSQTGRGRGEERSVNIVSGRHVVTILCYTAQGPLSIITTATRMQRFVPPSLRDGISELSLIQLICNLCPCTFILLVLSVCPLCIPLTCNVCPLYIPLTCNDCQCDQSSFGCCRTKLHMFQCDLCSLNQISVCPLYIPYHV